MAFDPATRTFDLSYSTLSPSGRRSGWWLPSVVHVPRLAYPEGYSVQADGAWVVSRKCSERLVLSAKPWARSVTVRLTPGTATCGR